MDYEELKNKIKEYGFNLKEFANYVGVHPNTTTKWKNNTVPLWVVRVIEGLEYKRDLKSCEDRIKRMCKESS